jgi:predicted tellurium resistance membrane protein TerC
VIGQLLAIVRRYPALVDGAFIIIAWVGIKLFLEYFRAIHVLEFEVPRWLSLGLIVLIFVAAFIYARRQGAVPDDPGSEDDAGALMAREDQDRR